MQTEYAFILPRGYRDEAGTVHRERTMRLATARDEIEPLRDPAVRANEAYLTLLLLARVITRIGPVTDVGPDLVEALCAADFDHLQRVYARINTDRESVGVVVSPECRHEFEVDLSEIQDGPGEMTRRVSAVRPARQAGGDRIWTSNAPSGPKPAYIRGNRRTSIPLRQIARMAICRGFVANGAPDSPP
jgi:hypothetical protein